MITTVWLLIGIIGSDTLYMIHSTKTECDEVRAVSEKFWPDGEFECKDVPYFR